MFMEWSNNIRQTLCCSFIHTQPLETLKGYLNHVTNIVQAKRHFLNHLRVLKTHAGNSKHGSVSLSPEAKEDLALCLEFLKVAHQGISKFIMLYCKLTNVYHSDASEHGIGGYSLTSRQAWTF